jgi:hypothetical protein
MRFADALDEIVQKEQEARKRLQAAGKKAEAIRYKGEEEASEIYSNTRNKLKKQTTAYSQKLKNKLKGLEKELESDLRMEARKIRSNAEKKKKKAEDAGYEFMVGQV